MDANAQLLDIFAATNAQVALHRLRALLQQMNRCGRGSGGDMPGKREDTEEADDNGVRMPTSLLMQAGTVELNAHYNLMI